MDAQSHNISNANGSITNPMVSINQLNQAFNVTRPNNPNNPNNPNSLNNPNNSKQLEHNNEHSNEGSSESGNKVETFNSLSNPSSNQSSNPSILPDATNQKFTDLAKSEVVSDVVNDAVNASSPTAVEHRDFEDSKNSNNKKGRKPKLASIKSENVKSEVADSEQVTISFSILAKEKKQIEAVAILSGYDSVGEFITKLVSQGMKPYLDAVSQALNKDKS